MFLVALIAAKLAIAQTDEACATAEKSNTCFLPAPYNETWTCQTGNISAEGGTAQSVNCITTGCSINTFAQPDFMCFCKGTPAEQQIPDNQFFVSDGSCCLVNNGF